MLSSRTNSHFGTNMKHPIFPSSLNGFLIIYDYGHKNKRHFVDSICKYCIKKFKVELQNLKKIKSCGCKRGCGYPKRLQSIYNSMISRCYDPSHLTYKNYGGKGIIVFKDWLESKISFCEWAINNGYAESLTIDRISPELGYFPENCQWITMQEQIQRRRTVTKLNRSLVLSIRNDLLSMKNVDVAKKYNIHKVHISGIKTKKYWDNI